MKNIRTDIVIAVCALLVSALATSASWWQSRVVAQQLSAQVWPYVSVVNTFGPRSVGVDVSNDFLGPAILNYCWRTPERGRNDPVHVANCGDDANQLQAPTASDLHALRS